MPKFEAAIAASQATRDPTAQGRPANDRSDHLAAGQRAKWRIPAEQGNWHHAYLRFSRAAVNGVWDKIMAHVVAEAEPKLAFACMTAPWRGAPESGRLVAE